MVKPVNREGPGGSPTPPRSPRSPRSPAESEAEAVARSRLEGAAPLALSPAELNAQTRQKIVQDLNEWRERMFTGYLGPSRPPALSAQREYRERLQEKYDKILSAFDTDAQELDLSNFFFNELPQCIGLLSELRHLNLSGCRLSDFPITLLKCTKLKTLKLWGTGLTNLPDSFAFPLLEELDLSKNKLPCLPQSLQHCTQLKILKLKETTLTNVPDSFAFPLLEELDLSTNQFTCLPAMLPNCKKLKRLNLSHNQMIQPPNVSVFSELEELDLGSNQLHHCPLLMGCTQLKILKLQNNELTDLPDSFEFPLLKELYLSGNKLKHIPAALSHCGQLKKFYFAHNQCEDLPESFPPPSMETLDLSYNQLRRLPAALSSCANLNLLYATENKIENFPSVTFRCLEHLWLEGNQLQCLPATLGSCERLCVLRVAGNCSLNVLPMSLGSCNLTEITRADTQISRDQADTIIALCQFRRATNVDQLLPQRLRLWETYSGRPAGSLDFVLKFTIEERIAVNEWLLRLERTADFGTAQDKMTHLACAMLDDVNRHEEFRAAFMDQVRVNNEACGDRAAMAFNEMYLAQKLMCPQGEQTLVEKLQFLRGVGKTLALRQALEDRMATQPASSLGESVEINLYYETQLKERLGLISPIETMRYGTLGQRAWIDEEVLCKQVEKTWIDHVLDVPSVKTLIEEDPELSRTFAQHHEKSQKEMEQIEAEKASMTDGQYTDAMSACQKELKDALKGAFAQWFEQKLQGSQRGH